MSRRKPYSKVVKENRVLAKHVKGMGDVVFVGFQCLNPECRHYLFVQKDEISEVFEIDCPNCGYSHRSGDESKFFNYKVTVKNDDGTTSIVNEGVFSISHDEYIAEAQEYKYCILCNTLKPLHLFSRHKSRKSGKQGECKLCKDQYNSIKNGTRLTDQHREAAQKRRLYLDLSGTQKINSKKIYERFQYKCFNCNKDLRNEKGNLDHTLPVYYLWPLKTEDATLLCKDCNGEKAEKWPSAFYSEQKLRQLSVITGISYELLAGEPKYNDEAIENLKNPSVVDHLLIKYSAYMDEIIKLRNRLLSDINFDFFQYSTSISEIWIRKANEEYNKRYRK